MLVPDQPLLEQHSVAEPLDLPTAIVNSDNNTSVLLHSLILPSQRMQKGALDFLPSCADDIHSVCCSLLGKDFACL